MLDILESKGDLSSKDESKLNHMEASELIELIRRLMRESYDLLSAMEYLHAQDLSELESSLLKRFQALEETSQTSLEDFEKDLQNQENYLTSMGQKLNSTTSMLGSID